MENPETENANVNHYKMAEEYLKNKNYSASCFMFIRSIKVKLATKIGAMSDLEDMEKLTVAGGANLSREEVKKVQHIMDRIIEKNIASKEDCLFVKKLSESI